MRACVAAYVKSPLHPLLPAPLLPDRLPHRAGLEHIPRAADGAEQTKRGATSLTWLLMGARPGRARRLCVRAQSRAQKVDFKLVCT